MLAERVPERYEVTVERPADFAEFWAETMTAAAAIPLNPRLDHIPLRSTPEVDTYELHYDSLDGLRIAGWYCVPRGSTLPPPYPALLLAPGYISEPTLPKSWARKGYAAIGLAPRGKLRSNAVFNPGYPGLLVHHITDRDTYSYRGFYVDATRAVDVLLGRPEVDAGRIGIYGSSQGGTLALTTAALRPDAIACGVAGVPYLCAIMDAARLTRSYPYEEINEYLRMHPDDEPLVRRTVAYFDGLNFAPRIQAPMLIYVGLEDDVCPPETGLAAYDALRGPKQLHALPRCAHDAGNGRIMPYVEEFLATHLKPARP